MPSFTSSLIILNYFLHLFFLGNSETLRLESTLHLARDFREMARAAPRGSYKRIYYYHQSLRLDPDEAPVYLELGEEYYDLAISYGNRDLFDKAIRNYRAALKLEPALVRPHCRLGAIYFLLGDFQLSRRELEKAHSIKPHNPTANNGLRILREIRRDRQERENRTAPAFTPGS